MNQITKSSGVSFHWGLPRVDLRRGLLWKPHQSDILTFRKNFPSWSWTGSIGRVTFNYWLVDVNDYASVIIQPPSIESGKLPPAPVGEMVSVPYGMLNPPSNNIPVSANITVSPVASKLNRSQLTVSSAIARVRVSCVRKAGVALGHLPRGSKQEKNAVGDHWTILDRHGHPLKDEAGEYPTFERCDYFFRLHPTHSAILAKENNFPQMVLIETWPRIRDSSSSNRWLYNMVSALVIIKIVDNRYWRLASVLMREEDWVAMDPVATTIQLE